MKQILFFLISLTIIAVLTVSCFPSDKHYQTGKLPLRQLVNTSDTVKYSRGGFFLVAGSYSSGEYTNDVIKMYALVDGAYKYLEYNMRDVRITIDNTVDIPYIIVYASLDGPGAPESLSDEDITSIYSWRLEKVILYTPEQYLPEHLLPIKLK